MKKSREMPAFELLTVSKGVGNEDWFELVCTSRTRFRASLVLAGMVGVTVGLWSGLLIDHDGRAQAERRHAAMLAMVEHGAPPIDAACSLSIINPDSRICVLDAAAEVGKSNFGTEP